jgi:hypothetical protein
MGENLDKGQRKGWVFFFPSSKGLFLDVRV